jgi:hypothetical protein
MNTVFCEICHEDCPAASISKVDCGSTVAHNLCHYCEGEWRSKMPLQENGMRIMNCPTCRRPEQVRTMESLQREIVRLNRLFADITTNTTINAMEISVTDEEFLEGLFDGFNFNEFSFTLPSVTVRPRRVHSRSACVSGRDCQSRSQRRRTVTHLKCNVCNVVFCCRNCRTCVGCAPI